MKLKCKCHPDSPFHWRHNLQQRQKKPSTTSVRPQIRTISVKQFNIFSRAGQVL